MNIFERSLSAYTVICLTGVGGENDSRIYEVVSGLKSNTRHPLLKDVAKIARRQDPASRETQLMVRAVILNWLKTKEGENEQSDI